jgi:hypothetical protein
MSVRIGCVVEGAGEVAALPILIRRIGERLDPPIYPEVDRPVIIKRSRLDERFGELERGVELAVRSLPGPGGLLILLDSDRDCPAELGPTLLERAARTRPDIPLGVVLACREYEAWFLAAAESLRGRRGLPADLEVPADPEAVRGAKEKLRRHEPRERRSDKETTDQPAFTAIFDLDLARQRAPSFDKCWREVVRLLTLLQQAEQAEPGATEPEPEQPPEPGSA